MSFHTHKKMSLSRLISYAGIFCAALLMTTPARAAFHLWNVQEVYSNSSGNLQFIELSTTSNNQQFVGGQQISISSLVGAFTNTYTVPTNAPGASTNKTLLFGTAGLQASGGPTPDYIIPNNFLFTAGGTLSFFGANSGAYTALPTDGTMSRNWLNGSNNAVNSPTNFAGQTGVIPEPTATIFVTMAFGTMFTMSRRRRRKSVSKSA